MQTFLYILACLAVTAVFAWFLVSLLDMISLPLVRLGITTQKFFHVEPLEEKNAWLFALLISITRVPVILLASASFFLYLLTLLSPSDGLQLSYQILFSTCWIITVMRVGSIFLGSVLLGTPMQDIMKSLHG